MKKLFALMTAALLMLTACQGTEDAEAEESEIEDVSLTNRPGEYLADYVDTLTVGSHTFPFTASQSEAAEIFGEDMKDTVIDKQAYSETYEEYIFDSDIVDDGYYWGYLTFRGESDDPDNASLDVFMSGVTFDGDNGIRDVWDIDESGEYVRKEYLFEEGKVTEKVNGFTTGISTRKEIQEHFGEGEYWDVEIRRGENYVFEDYAIVFYYDENDIFYRCFIMYVKERNVV